MSLIKIKRQLLGESYLLAKTNNTMAALVLCVELLNSIAEFLSEVFGVAVRVQVDCNGEVLDILSGPIAMQSAPLAGRVEG